MKYRILYVEDDLALSRIVSDNLLHKGYEVIAAHDGVSAMDLFNKVSPDLCLLDVMMPAMDGFSLSETIRKSGASTPVIFLSAKALAEDVVQGFKSGGNDYMRKPFSIIELLARIESLLTRFHGSKASDSPQTIYEFGPCVLDTVSQRLSTPAQTFSLSHKESRLLEMLLQHRNAILERQEALLAIWGNDTQYNSNSMNVFITHIRKMLERLPGVQIINVRGLGYKLVC